MKAELFKHQAFLARLIIFCDTVTDTCSLTDMGTLKTYAANLKKEALEIWDRSEAPDPKTIDVTYEDLL